MLLLINSDNCSLLCILLFPSLNKQQKMKEGLEKKKKNDIASMVCPRNSDNLSLLLLSIKATKIRFYFNFILILVPLDILSLWCCLVDILPVSIGLNR